MKRYEKYIDGINKSFRNSTQEEEKSLKNFSIIQNNREEQIANDGYGLLKDPIKEKKRSEKHWPKTNYGPEETEEAVQRKIYEKYKERALLDKELMQQIKV